MRRLRLLPDRSSVPVQWAGAHAIRRGPGAHIRLEQGAERAPQTGWREAGDAGKGSVGEGGADEGGADERGAAEGGADKGGTGERGAEVGAGLEVREHRRPGRNLRSTQMRKGQRVRDRKP